ncbi:MAG: DUF1802 family protein [Leptolyngbyaceae cyanobacterium CSU_1_3]|nr:DUF1802 family protein [Leptolyngbyaceae cyanobacterium CSU_1_3]
MTPICHALKEWAIAVNALEQGNTIILLRKGGIREDRGRFIVAHKTVLLYPTYEHQQPHLLKNDQRSQVQPVPSGWHPETVRIGSVAEITHIVQVTEAAVLEALLPFHIWNAEFVSERFQWKPRSPLYVLLLRVSRLSQVHTIPYRAAYGGCRSWLDLETAIDLENAIPVINDTSYSHQVQQISEILSFAHSS